MAEEQATLDRDAIANEVWGDADESPPTQVIEAESEPTEVVTAETETVAAEPEAEADPWAGVSPALRAEVEGLRAKVGSLDEMGYRLKQAESRLGGVLNELHQAKEVAKTTAQAPSKEQIEAAASSAQEWSELKNDFPEWAVAIDTRLAAERAEILSKLPNTDSLREEMQKASGEELKQLKIDFAKTVVSLKHPKWEETTQSPEYQAWDKQTGSRNSYDPLEVIALLDEFAEFKAKQKSPETIINERKARLELAQTTPGHRLKPAKSESDMSESELRAVIAKQVFG